jgi:hypothetical protein
MGKKLRGAEVSHVVCWRSEVRDDTAREFARQFYASLNSKTCHGPGTTDARSCTLLRASSLAVVPCVHLLSTLLPAGAVDYVCLLSENGDEFPDIGHIWQGQDCDSDSRPFGPPKDKELGSVGGSAGVGRVEPLGL